MSSSRVEFHLLHIYREGILSAAYSAGMMVRQGRSAPEIARALHRQAFHDDFGPEQPPENDNRVRQP
ncbi:hypothetical protein IBL26_18820 [Roseomonas aerophila]|uniref:Uncharacterized protein n=1 Tax=Teichococcus aerophilus TaxID=1224513 RepID=A0ABR7RQQ2_9PROT|nr:hypothetical protein [Pseudoroseomonas aerophila]MBC9208907.1 hypothetical protein [Pseudoroseomonas aerophila]